jgi:DNA-binding protein H-NS
MADIDLSTLTLDELLELELDIQRELERRRHEERATLLAQAQELAKRHGISLNELLKPPKKQRATPSAKYRNPEKPEQTWTGRGKYPAWVQQKIDAGVELEELIIPEATLADTPDDTARGRKQTTKQS